MKYGLFLINTINYPYISTKIVIKSLFEDFTLNIIFHCEK